MSKDNANNYDDNYDDISDKIVAAMVCRIIHREGRYTKTGRKKMPENAVKPNSKAGVRQQQILREKQSRVYNVFLKKNGFWGKGL